MLAPAVFRALVFDFDGLVLDTETCVYEAWRCIYAEHGLRLPLDRWCEAIGSDHSGFDPFEELRARVGPSLDVAEMQRRRREHRDALLSRMSPMPGVGPRLSEARARGLGVAIASSSPRAWVAGHLARLALAHHFEVLATADEVARVKPAPDLFQCAVSALQVRPAEAIALEDSPNGVAAAKAAGLRCVAVPGPMTRHLAFEQADLVIDSLAEVSLSELFECLAATGPGRPARPA